MYDSFPPFKQLVPEKFRYQSNYYEIWKEGKLIASGPGKIDIYCTVTRYGFMKLEVNQHSFNEPILASPVYFDIFFTLKDRMLLATIPANNTINDCIGLTTIRQEIGTTRESKHFKKNEPYCCSLFLKSMTIAKLTFTVNQPEKLIEFYSPLSDIDLPGIQRKLGPLQQIWEEPFVYPKTFAEADSLLRKYEGLSLEKKVILKQLGRFFSDEQMQDEANFDSHEEKLKLTPDIPFQSIPFLEYFKRNNGSDLKIDFVYNRLSIFDSTGKQVSILAFSRSIQQSFTKADLLKNGTSGWRKSILGL
ncbi:MAG: hypothetical protein IPG01_13300 [Chitinophagaceae bacterium]|nr:hypothetical protein [Chitinophagaceae bacterium]